MRTRVAILAIPLLLAATGARAELNFFAGKAGRRKR
jgi:hypothetical protein